MPASRVYLISQAVDGFAFMMMGVVYGVYLVVDANLDALQLMLLGTVLEATVLLFEIPTGVLADSVSRKLSVIVGMAIMGFGFALLGLTPSFLGGILGSFFFGLGFTFVSGAEVAWITDEVGEERAGPLYVRGAQFSQAGCFLGIVAAVALGSIELGLPIVGCGVIYVALAIFLAVAMREHGFSPPPQRARLTSTMSKTWRDGVAAVKVRPILWLVFAVAIAHGISTEAFDRLFALHIIKDVGLPAIGGLDRVVWFGILDGGGLLLAIGAAEFIKRRVDVGDRRAAVKALAFVDALLILGVVAFGLSGTFAIALTSFWFVALLREVRSPLFQAWVNQGLDPATRATVNSMASQMDAIGQMAGGPAIGWLAVARSVRVAIVTAGFLRLPTLAFFRKALRLASHEPIELEVEGVGLDIAGVPGPPHAPPD